MGREMHFREHKIGMLKCHTAISPGGNPVPISRCPTSCPQALAPGSH